MTKKKLQHRVFVINEEPYCVWGWDLEEQTRRFLDSLDPDHYEYLSEVHSDIVSDESLNENHRQQAALSIRAAYSQGLETLFAFLCAALQGPQSVPAWLNLYRVRDIEDIVSKIRNYQAVLTRFRVRVNSWQTVSEIIHQGLVLDDKEKESDIKMSFAKLWTRFAGQFVDGDFRQEYNSIKHGLRVRSGGFYLAFGAEATPGVPAPPENRRLVGYSDYGSSFWTAEKIATPRRHIQLLKHSRNWNPEDMANGLILISLSLSNIISFLKVLNGMDPQSVQFHWFSSEETYSLPWLQASTIGVQSFNFHVPVEADHIQELSKEELLSIYKDSDGGKRE